MNLASTLTIDNTSPLKSGRVSLRIGGIAAILASVCCLGAYLLVALGLSNTRILYLTTLAEWSRPFFIGLALISLCFAYQRIWHPISTYKPGQVCTTPQVKTVHKAYFWFVVMLVVIVLMLPYIIPGIS